MQNKSVHLSDKELILAADGELSAHRRAGVNKHLETCWSCRERMRSLETTITDFVRARNAELNRLVPPAAGPRALLRARLSQAAAVPPHSSFWQFPLPAARAVQLTAGAVFVGIVLVILTVFESTMSAEGPKPRLGITPGEARLITLEEVCSYQRAEVVSRDIPNDMRQKVFAAYGIKPAQADQFEVDYLITPDLGGTESIRNLWPQPYSARWNAHVKDKLEQRLHELVCGHQLDLKTAQRDIAVDWIGAYKKYVGENTAH